MFIFHRYQTQIKKKLYHDFVIISLIYPPHCYRCRDQIYPYPPFHSTHIHPVFCTTDNLAECYPGCKTKWNFDKDGAGKGH